MTPVVCEWDGTDVVSVMLRDNTLIPNRRQIEAASGGDVGKKVRSALLAEK